MVTKKQKERNRLKYQIAAVLAVIYAFIQIGIFVRHSDKGLIVADITERIAGIVGLLLLTVIIIEYKITVAEYKSKNKDVLIRRRLYLNTTIVVLFLLVLLSLQSFASSH